MTRSSSADQRSVVRVFFSRDVDRRRLVFRDQFAAAELRAASALLSTPAALRGCRPVHFTSSFPSELAASCKRDRAEESRSSRARSSGCGARSIIPPSFQVPFSMRCCLRFFPLNERKEELWTRAHTDTNDRLSFTGNWLTIDGRSAQQDRGRYSSCWPRKLNRPSVAFSGVRRQLRSDRPHIAVWHD